MGERKGQNHYYPPDFDYRVHKNLNAYHGTHALRERAKKIKEGILVIRFEMPFNVWCLGCNNHIGMGVRYNAEKKKIGMYYTTPLYEFRMKCHLCDNYFTIRTDPKNFDYEMVEGLRRQEKRFDSGELNNLAPVDRSFNLKLSADAMFKKEHDVNDKKKSESVEMEMDKLEYIQSRMYNDYGVNSLLRKTFRTEKKTLADIRSKDNDLKSRLSTEIALQPESKEDGLMAKKMLKYQKMFGFEEVSEKRKSDLLTQSIFSKNYPSTSSAGTSSRKNGRSLLVEKVQNLKRNAINVAISASRGEKTPRLQSIGVCSSQKKATRSGSLTSADANSEAINEAEGSTCDKLPQSQGTEISSEAPKICKSLMQISAYESGGESSDGT